MNPESQSRSKHSCPSCDKSYTQSHNLKKHMEKVHGLPVLKKNQPEHSCQQER